MSKICNIDLKSREEIFNQIEEYCREIVRELNPYQVMLFGSFATGDINEGSDIDIMVIADFKVSFLDRIKLLLDLNKLGLPIEAHWLYQGRISPHGAGGDPFMANVVNTGKILYQREP